MNPFIQWWAAESAKSRILPTHEESARRGWNAALVACEAIVAVKRDPCEPWLDEGDLTAALEVEVKT